MRGEIAEHLPLKACLLKIGAPHGHRAAINLDHEGVFCARREPKSESKIRNYAEVVQCSSVRELGVKGEGVLALARGLRKFCKYFGTVDELYVSTIGGGTLQGDFEIDDLDLVFDEGTSRLTVLPAPLRIPKFDAILFP